MSRPLVISWGELLWDLFPDGPRLGGAAANVAYHLAALGAEAVLVSRVGDDELGRRARRALAAAGVDVRFVQVDPEQPTGTVKVELVGGEPSFRIAEHVAWDRILADPQLLELAARADAICFGTLAQRTVLGETALREALARGPRHRICDLNLRPPHTTESVVRGSLGSATAVKLNRDELSRLEELIPFASPRNLLGHGLELLALTRGRDGAELWTRDGHWEHPGFPIDEQRGDRVGAGDAFAAVLALGLIEGLAPPELLERANRHAAFVASEPGAMPPRPGS